MISALAFLVRNRVRPRGLLRLNQPCHLDGTGMAFPWRVVRSAPGLGGSIVEDLTMGIELALKGHEPVFCIDAGVRSRLPGTESAAMQQRRRWEHGQLATLVQYGPRLVCQGVSRRTAGTHRHGCGSDGATAGHARGALGSGPERRRGSSFSLAARQFRFGPRS